MSCDKEKQSKSLPHNGKSENQEMSCDEEKQSKSLPHNGKGENQENKVNEEQQRRFTIMKEKIDKKNKLDWANFWLKVCEVVFIFLFLFCFTFCTCSPLNVIMDYYFGSVSIQDCPNEKMDMSDEANNELYNWMWL